jgi:catechol 2,3-dioxygenase-like lactoylglutathione lyase family enzyme
MFSKIGSVILLVEDMERSFEFYSKVLGLKIKTKSPDWIEFFDKGTTLALHPRKRKLEKENYQYSNINILVGFMVGDLDNLVSDLRQKHRFFKEPKQEPFGKHTIITDPDGHLISIAK